MPERLTDERLTDSQLRVLKKKLHNGLAVLLNEEWAAELLELRRENERLSQEITNLKIKILGRTPRLTNIGDKS